MKKLLILTVLFTGFSFTNSIANNSKEELVTDCVQLAMDVHDSWTSQGFSDRYASGKADDAYNDCVNHATTPQTPELVLQP